MTKKPSYEELEKKVKELEKENTELGRSEELLKRSEEKFAKAFNHSPTLMTISSIEDGKYMDVNESFVRITGYSREESIGTTSIDLGFLDPEDRSRLIDELTKTGHVDGMELALHKKDGNTLYCLYIGEIITIAGEQSLLSIATDITEHKQAEERIENINLVLTAIQRVNQLITKEKDREKLLQGACNNLIETRGYYNTWIALFDKPGKLLKTAEAGLGEDFLPMLEYLKRGELTDCGRTALLQSNVVITEDPSSTCRDCPIAEKYGGRGAMTIRLGHEEKVYGLLSVSTLKNLAVYKEEQDLFRRVAEDIAYALYNIEQEDKRKHAEKALKESEKKYRTLLETTLEGCWLINPELKTIEVNQALHKMLGYRQDEMIGKTPFDFVDDENRKIFIEQTSKISTTPHRSYEITLKKKNGQDLQTCFNATTLRDKSGAVQGSFAFVTDITQRKQTEQKLTEREKELEIKNIRLEEMNSALKILLEKRDVDKKELKEKVMTNIKELILPYVAKLKNTVLNHRQETFVDIIQSNIEEIISPFAHKLSYKYLNFTPTELKVAYLVKQGLHTKEIAELLGSSPETIAYHRKSMRKKLKLTDKKLNLRTHLLSLANGDID